MHGHEPGSSGSEVLRVARSAKLRYVTRHSVRNAITSLYGIIYADFWSFS